MKPIVAHPTGVFPADFHQRICGGRLGLQFCFEITEAGAEKVDNPVDGPFPNEGSWVCQDFHQLVNGKAEIVHHVLWVNGIEHVAFHRHMFGEATFL